MSQEVSHDNLNRACVPYWWMNDPTLDTKQLWHTKMFALFDQAPKRRSANAIQACTASRPHAALLSINGM